MIHSYTKHTINLVVSADMAPRRNEREPLASSDDETVSLTSTKASEPQEIYTLDAVLWEKDDEDGKTWYLVKWEGYPDIRCTWVLEEHFQDEETLVDWADRKMKISRRLVEPFDYDGWKQRVEDAKTATAQRKARRRQKRIELGLPVADAVMVEEVEEEEQEPSSNDPSDDEYDGNLPDSDDSGTSVFSENPHWTAKEESTLLEGLKRFKTLDWKKLLSFYGSSGIINEDLKEKTEKDLRRKTSLLKKDFRASGREFPVSQPLDKTSGKNKQSKGEDGAVRNERDQQKQKPTGNESVGRTKYPGAVHPSQPQGPPRAPSNAINKQERQKAKIPPTEPSNSHGAANVSAIPKALTSAKSKVNANSASSQRNRRPSLSSTTAAPRSSQLGALGRGPARRKIPIMERPKEQPGNVMKNWGGSALKKPRSRYDPRTPQEVETNPGKTFKKFSTQRKFELAGRFEHEPDASSLTFLNLKDGKILPKGPSSIVPRPATKTPFQLLQEQIGEGEPSSRDESARPNLQRAATLDVSMNSSKSAGPAVEPNALAQATRRASVPSIPVNKPVQQDEPMSAAPVAVMNSNVNENSIISFEQCVSPQYEVCLLPKSNESIKITETARKRGSEEPSKPNLHPGIPTSPASSLPRPLSHSNLYVHPERKQSTSSHQEPSQPVLPQPIAANLQARELGYELFPLDVPRHAQNMKPHRQNDVIAEILIGNEGDSVGKVVFRGLSDDYLWHLFLTIKRYPDLMHVWCKDMVTAGEFSFTFHDLPSYLGSGWIVPNHRHPPSIANVDMVSSLLAEHASGGIFFAERFMLLLYPARCIGWDFLDSELPHVPLEARLRFAMLKPWPKVPQMPNKVDPRSVMSDNRVKLHAPPINAVLSSHFGMDFQRLIASSKNRDSNKARLPMFFLLFPPAAQEEYDVVVDWIQANGPATIYKHSDQGAWAQFYKMVEQGVVICHATFIDYWNIPYLAHTLKKTVSMFNFSLEPMSHLAPDPHLVRLFPAGTAFLLTDSLFLLRPIETARILLWFRLFILQVKPHGTWKICTRPAVREWLLRIQEKLRPPNGNDFVSCYGEVMRLSSREVAKDGCRYISKDKEFITCMGAGKSNFDETLGTTVRHLAEMKGEAIVQNDNTLSSWFAGWAMTKQEKFRRFHIVTGRDDESEEHRRLKERMKKYSHVEVYSFEKFADYHKVWDSAKLKRKDNELRAEAGKTKKAAAAKVSDWRRRESAATAGSEDVEMHDAPPAEEQSLFLPMDESPT